MFSWEGFIMSQDKNGGFIPKLTTTDWNEEWKELQHARHAADNVDYWNERSKTFGNNRADKISPYVARFLELAHIEPNETVFDMGCGNGALACPLARDNHRVLAADFSQGMLDALQKQCDEHNITNVETKLMSWDDDWSDFGIEPNSFDVAIASRSIATTDLEKALERLIQTARRRICITLAAGTTPRSDENIMNDIGVTNYVSGDYLYAFMILTSLGFHPELNYIRSARYDTYNNKQDALENLGKMVEHSMSVCADRDEINQALDRLSNWLDDNLIKNPEEGQPDNHDEPQKAYKLKHPRTIRWAFISCNKDN